MNQAKEFTIRVKMVYFKSELLFDIPIKIKIKSIKPISAFAFFLFFFILYFYLNHFS